MDASRIPPESTTGRVRVWDLPTRLFHWGLVAAVALALALGFFGPKRLLDLHLWAGYAAAALVVFRLIWGFAGSTFARFAAFPPAPKAVLAHLSGRHVAGYGHNPLGALMVYTLLAILLALAVTGVLTLGGVVRQGPFSALTTYAGGRTAKEIHELLAWGVVALVALHLGGVLFESLREKENLARAMVTGWKRSRDDATPERRARPALSVAASAAVALSTAAAWTFATRLPNPYVPAGPALAEWRAECGDCHTPHHPSLLPAERWTAIMATLDDHFGEDASLDADATARIRDWLVANAAERYDTRAANSFRQPDAAEPLRITATARWKRIHDDIPSETFRRKDIGGPANCAACHGDAEAGLFAPQQISIPQPPKEPS